MSTISSKNASICPVVLGNSPFVRIGACCSPIFRMLRPRVPTRALLVLTAASFGNNDKFKDSQPPLRFHPSLPISTPLSQPSSDSSNNVNNLVKKSIAAKSLVAAIHKAVMTGACWTDEANSLFYRLEREVGLENLTINDLEILLRTFITYTSPGSLETEKILKVIKDNGFTDQIASKEGIFISACRKGHLQVVLHLLPYVKSEDRLSVLNSQPSSQ